MEICRGADNVFVFDWGVQFYGGVDVECELVLSDETPECDPQESLEEYGRLYHRHALDDSRGCVLNEVVHTPEEAGWDIMFDHLGGLEVAGGKMRSTYGWEDEGNGTNVSSSVCHHTEVDLRLSIAAMLARGGIRWNILSFWETTME